ncbi:MAG: Gfo/Idh/MocA family oxidoreductase [Planctomycetes bacterium]|nr:Gfo/Idh/MocA family oxidoreductase [Planctomycetota bacterium]
MAGPSFTRRSFVRAAGASAAALGLRTGVFGADQAIKVAVIGTGGRGQHLLRVLQNHGSKPWLEHMGALRIAAVCDLVPERAAQAAAICKPNHPGVETFTDFRKMLDDVKPEACIVATDEVNHAPVVIPVLEAGVHCFSEKPIDIAVEKVDAVVRAARKAKGIYQVGYQRRYAPTFRTCLQAIHRGDVGRILFLQGHWQWAGGVGGRYLDMDNAGCWFLAQACHHADAMAWVMGDVPPLRVAAIGAVTAAHANPPLHCAEDHSSIAFEFPGKVIFSYTHLMSCCPQFCGEKLWVYAEKGGIDLIEGMKYPLEGAGEPVRLGEKAPDWDHGTYEELDGFARHILYGEKPLSGAESARISALMGIMAGRAMYKRATRTWEPTVVAWEELGSKV